MPPSLPTPSTGVRGHPVPAPLQGSALCSQPWGDAGCIWGGSHPPPAPWGRGHACAEGPAVPWHPPALACALRRVVPGRPGQCMGVPCLHRVNWGGEQGALCSCERAHAYGGGVHSPSLRPSLAVGAGCCPPEHCQGVQWDPSPRAACSGGTWSSGPPPSLIPPHPSWLPTRLVFYVSVSLRVCVRVRPSFHGIMQTVCEHRARCFS